jgi:FMN phosphatase YigB (HAD superfamily)
MRINEAIISDILLRIELGVSAVLGCDIFDTLITRIIPKEQAFQAMCRAVARKFCGGPSLHEKIAALYNDAYLSSCDENVSKNLDYEASTDDLFDQWVFGINHNFGLSITRKDLEQCILDHEKTIMVAMPNAMTLLRAVKSHNVRIILISDMFYGAAFIERLLHALGFEWLYDQMYVSSDFALLKRTGRLFEKVLEIEKIDPTSFVFCGDDAVADVQKPSQLNIAAHHYVFNDLEIQREEIRNLYSNSEINRSSLLRGIIYSAGGPQFEFNSVEKFSVKKYIGPYFSTFGLAILENINKKNYGHVLFAAREGLLLLKITNIIERIYDLPQRAQKTYLPASRLVALAFSLADHPLSIAEMVNLARNGRPCVRTVASFLRLDEAALQALATEAGLESPDTPFHDDLLNWAPAHNLLAAINARPELKRFRQIGHRFLIWFQQNGLQDGQLKLFVDLGWAGQIQDSLAKGFARRGIPVAMDGLYSGMRLEAHWRRRPGCDFFWVHADEAGDDPLALPPLWFPQILETLCRAPHGTAIGFRLTEDEVTILPEFEEDRSPTEVADDPLLCRVQTLVCEYVERFAYLCALYGVSSSEFRGLILTSTFKFLMCPETDVARRYAGFCNISDMGSKTAFAFRGGMGDAGRDHEFFAALEATTLWPTGAAASFFGEEASKAYAEQHIRLRAKRGSLFRREGLTAFNRSGPLNADTIEREAAVSPSPVAMEKSAQITKAFADRVDALARQHGRTELCYRRPIGKIWLDPAEEKTIRSLVERALAEPSAISWPLGPNTEIYKNERRGIPHQDIIAARNLAEERYAVIQSMDNMIFERDKALIQAGQMAKERLRVLQQTEARNQTLEAELQAAATLCEERLAAINEMGGIIHQRDQKIRELEAKSRNTDVQEDRSSRDGFGTQSELQRLNDVIAGQERLILERWDAIQEMGRFIYERDQRIAALEAKLADSSGTARVT